MFEPEVSSSERRLLRPGMVYNKRPFVVISACKQITPYHFKLNAVLSSLKKPVHTIHPQMHLHTTNDPR